MEKRDQGWLSLNVIGAAVVIISIIAQRFNLFFTKEDAIIATFLSLSVFV